MSRARLPNRRYFRCAICDPVEVSYALHIERNLKGPNRGAIMLQKVDVSAHDLNDFRVWIGIKIRQSEITPGHCDVLNQCATCAISRVNIRDLIERCAV